MICPKCSEYRLNRSDWLYLTINFFPAKIKNHVRIKLNGINQKAFICPNCHGISRFSLLAANLRLIGILVMFAGLILNVSYEQGGAYQNHVMILTWFIGLLGFFMIIKPNFFCLYHLDLLDATEEDLVRYFTNPQLLKGIGNHGWNTPVGSNKKAPGSI
ncbi:MAG: hypothetical protein ISR86_09100 [Nitrospinaceae bacterium]|nr:hypothetical protein [Nitrospinaceae bacterium]